MTIRELIRQLQMLPDEIKDTEPVCLVPVNGNTFSFLSFEVFSLTNTATFKHHRVVVIPKPNVDTPAPF